MIRINCSEIRLYYLNKVWWLQSILRQSGTNRKGVIMHKAVAEKLTNAEKSELNYQDIQKIKQVDQKMTGKRTKGYFKVRGVLQGMCDGFIDGIPVEIKYGRQYPEDKLQAQAYCYLYNSDYAYLIYPREKIKVTLDDLFLDRLREVYNEKIKIVGGCCDGTC